MYVPEREGRPEDIPLKIARQKNITVPTIAATGRFIFKNIDNDIFFQVRKTFVSKKEAAGKKKELVVQDLCEENYALLQNSFDTYFGAQLDLKNSVAAIMGKIGATPYNSLTAQVLFPEAGPLMVDLAGPELRDAFVTGSLYQYASMVDEQLGISIERAAGKPTKIKINLEFFYFFYKKMIFHRGFLVSKGAKFHAFISFRNRVTNSSFGNRYTFKNYVSC